MSTPSFAFPQSLAEKYRPRTIGDFAGLEKPKKILRKFAANPYPSAWLFVGPPGVGKTTMALALAETLSAELHHIPSQQCNVSAVEDVIRQCWYIPRSGFHLVLVDEADRMSNAAQLQFLSKLDATAYPPQTIFIFTCNAIEGLEPRFLSRTRQLEFSSYGLASETIALLQTIWQREASDAPMPAFAQIVKQSRNNVRDALMPLETELLAVSIPHTECWVNSIGMDVVKNFGLPNPSSFPILPSTCPVSAIIENEFNPNVRRKKIERSKELFPMKFHTV